MHKLKYGSITQYDSLVNRSTSLFPKSPLPIYFKTFINVPLNILSLINFLIYRLATLPMSSLIGASIIPSSRVH